jgi:alpha,alpha-trehalose phosphorylase
MPSARSPGTHRLQALACSSAVRVSTPWRSNKQAEILDHHDSAHNTSDGLHLAALAGAWTAVIAGLAGARERDGKLSVAPSLPEPLSRIAFPFAFQGRVLRVEFTPCQASYELRAGAPIFIEHWGTSLLLTRQTPAVAAIPPAEAIPPLRQPAGRAPKRRGTADDDAGPP